MNGDLAPASIQTAKISCSGEMFKIRARIKRHRSLVGAASGLSIPQIVVPIRLQRKLLSLTTESILAELKYLQT